MRWSTPLSMTRGGQTYYYHTNAHGDVLALTNANGDVVASYTYDPWGAPTSATGTVANPYRYAGYRFDSATGLYYLLNRYYSPESCRFITRDLLAGDAKQPATMNHHAYCLGDPVNADDPSGLKVRVYYTPLFGWQWMPVRHAWVGDRELSKRPGRGQSGMWGGLVTLGNPVGTDWDHVNPGQHFESREVDVPDGETEEHFMYDIEHYQGWNQGTYGWIAPSIVPRLPLNALTFACVGAGNDCHDQVARAIRAAGGSYPGSGFDDRVHFSDQVYF
jgi:RHS repeat-associated protein